MSAGGETPRTDEPEDSVSRAADLALEALDVTLRGSGLELRSAVIVLRLEADNPETGLDGGFGYAGANTVDDDDAEVIGLLERGLRAVRRTRPA